MRAMLWGVVLMMLLLVVAGCTVDKHLDVTYYLPGEGLQGERDGGLVQTNITGHWTSETRTDAQAEATADVGVNRR